MNIENLKNKIRAKNKAVEMEVKKDFEFQVGKEIEIARSLKGMTQEDLAKKIGTKQPSIARIESGSSLPSLSFLKKIAEAFDTYLIAPRFAFMVEKEEQEKSSTESIYFNIFNTKGRGGIREKPLSVKSVEHSQFTTFQTG